MRVLPLPPVQVLGSSFSVNPASGMTSKMMTKLNDALVLHEIHDQAQEKAAALREQQVGARMAAAGMCAALLCLRTLRTTSV